MENSLDEFVIVDEHDLEGFKGVEHNRQVLSELKPGDLIEFKRSLYSHWAVYIGNSKVIHYTGTRENSRLTVSGVNLSEIHMAEVVVDDYWDVVEDSRVFRNNLFDKVLNPLPVDQILIRAYEKVGDKNFCIFSNNCEHFAKYCRYGVNSSDQVMKLYRFGNHVTRNLKKLVF